MQEEKLAHRRYVHLRGFLTCASFFNLSLIPLWGRYKYDYVDLLPYGKMFVFVLVAGAFLYLSILFVRRRWQGPRLQLLALTGFLLFPLDGVRQGLNISVGSLQGIMEGASAFQIRMAFLLIALMVLPLIYKYRVGVLDICRGFLLLMSPLLLSSGYLAASRTGSAEVVEYYKQESRPRQVMANTDKLRLILLDEADYQLIFEHRPQTIELPMLDKMQKSCMTFTQAYSAGHDTIISIPAMLMGQKLKSVEHNGLRLGVTNANGRYSPDWRTTNHLLRSTQSRGLRVGVVGGYHAYCNKSDQYFSYCSHMLAQVWASLHFKLLPWPLALYQSNILIKRVVKWYYEVWPINTVPQNRQRHMYEYLTESAWKAVQFSDFLYFHTNLPHPPSIYGEDSTSQFNPFFAASKEGYYANVLAVDEMLGRFIEHDHELNPDNQLIYIITSDHGLRLSSRKKWGNVDLSSFGNLEDRPVSEERHVPLLFCISGVESGLLYTNPVNLVAIRGVIELMFDDKLHGYEKIARYFDDHQISLDEIQSYHPVNGP